MSDEDKTFSGSLVLDVRIWCTHTIGWFYSRYHPLVRCTTSTLYQTDWVSCLSLAVRSKCSLIGGTAVAAVFGSFERKVKRYELWTTIEESSNKCELCFLFIVSGVHASKRLKPYMAKNVNILTSLWHFTVLKYFKRGNTAEDGNAGIDDFWIDFFICSPRGNHQKDFTET